jgi:hypothetical protein
MRVRVNPAGIQMNGAPPIIVRKHEVTIGTFATCPDTSVKATQTYKDGAWGTEVDFATAAVYLDTLNPGIIKQGEVPILAETPCCDIASKRIYGNDDAQGTVLNLNFSHNLFRHFAFLLFSLFI